MTLLSSWPVYEEANGSTEKNSKVNCMLVVDICDQSPTGNQDDELLLPRLPYVKDVGKYGRRDLWLGGCSYFLE